MWKKYALKNRAELTKFAIFMARIYFYFISNNDIKLEWEPFHSTLS